MKHLVGNYCSPHTHGVPQGMKAFFVPGCITCEAKKAAGTVTGNEPLPFADFRKRNSSNIAAHIRRARAEKAAR